MAKDRAVADIESDITQTFLVRLTQSKDVPANVIADLKRLLAGESLPIAEQLTELYAAGAESQPT